MENAAITRCVTEGRCMLCRFAIEDGDLVLVEVEHWTVEFEFKSQSHFSSKVGDNTDIEIHMCLRPRTRCQLSEAGISCLHRACRRTTPLRLSEEFVAATAFSFSPDSIDMERRESLLRREFAFDADRWCPGLLPPELWYMVADYYSLKEYAALKAERLSMILSTPRETVLNITLPIYIAYTVIEGTDYIFSLSNEGEGLPTMTQSISRIDVGGDYFGIRQLCLHDKSDVIALPEDTVGKSSIWWSDLSGHRFLRILHDGLKVRQIRPMSPISTDLSLVRFPTPGVTPVQMIKLIPDPSLEYGRLRMQALRCNSPDVIGYFALICPTGTITIHEHAVGIDTNFYQQSEYFPGMSPVWMYMPMHSNEYLEALYTRLRVHLTGQHVYAADNSLTFTTNWGRQVTFGPHVEPSRDGLQHKRLSLLPRSPFRIFLSHWKSDPHMSALVFEDLSRQDSEVVATALQPPSAHMWYHSACQLSNVTEVVLCRKYGKDGGRVLGMLLLYNNGSRSSVGQYRLDWVTQPISVCGGFFKVASARFKFGCRDVDLELDVTRAGQRSNTWRVIPWSGRMDWWFTKHTFFIQHHAA